MTKIATKRWNPVEHIRDDADVAAYIEAALEDGDHRVARRGVGRYSAGQGYDAGGA